MAVMNRTNPSSLTITKVPSACRIKAVFMMDIEKCVKEAQNHNTILKTPQEHPGGSSRVVSSFLVVIS